MITSYFNLLVIKLFINCNFLFKWFNELHFWVGSLVAQTVKNLPAMRETRVPSLGWEDPLNKEMAAHSSILAWKIPWTMEPGRLPSMELQRVRHDWVTSLRFMGKVTASLLILVSMYLHILLVFFFNSFFHILFYFLLSPWTYQKLFYTYLQLPSK